VRRAALALALALALGWFSALPALAGCAPGTLELRGDWGRARFSVEVADDDAERSRGLMFRERLARGAGMLFVYDRPQRATFWMKNTLIPLDMIFIAPDGRVTRVHPEAEPGSLEMIDGGAGVLAVLEINGGLAARLRIGPGTEVRHPAFGDGAAWPCDD
jgi:uncharacterized membrane protein (UPF0127 family)